MAGSERVNLRSVAKCVGVLALLVSMSDCEEFARNNPHDPLVPVTVTIEGPDRSYAQFDTLHFTVKTDPEFDHETPVWEATIDKLDQGGTFRTPAIGAIPTKAQISVRVGTRTASKLIDLTYRPASFRVRNCVDSSHVVRISALQDTAFVCSKVLDAHGGWIADYMGFPHAPITSRALDPSVVQPGASEGQIVSLKNGTTPVIFTASGFSDTMTVVVQQEVAFVTATPASCTDDYSLTMRVGTTLQLGVSAPAYDLTRHPVTDAAVVHRALGRLSWFVYDQFTSSISVTPAGLVTARAPGYVVVTAAVPDLSYSGNLPAFCLIRVQ